VQATPSAVPTEAVNNTVTGSTGMYMIPHRKRFTEQGLHGFLAFYTGLAYIVCTFAECKELIVPVSANQSLSERV